MTHITHLIGMHKNDVRDILLDLGFTSLRIIPSGLLTYMDFAAGRITITYDEAQLVVNIVPA